MINSKLDIQVWRLLSCCCCLKLRHHIEIEEAGDKGTWHFSNRLVIVLNGFIILAACLADTVFRTLFLNLKSLEVLAGFQLRIFLGYYHQFGESIRQLALCCSIFLQASLSKIVGIQLYLTNSSTSLGYLAKVSFSCLA